MEVWGQMADLGDVADFWGAVHQSVLPFDDVLFDQLHQKLIDLLVLLLVQWVLPFLFDHFDFGEQEHSVLVLYSS